MGDNISEVFESVQRFITEYWLIKLILSGLSTAAVFLFGAFDAAAIALCALMLIDLMTGLWVASRNNNLSSKISFHKTRTKIIGYFIVVSVGNLIGTVAPLLGFTRTWAITYLAVSEGISIIENLSLVGVKCLEGVAKKLKQTRENLIEKAESEVMDG